MTAATPTASTGGRVGRHRLTGLGRVALLLGLFGLQLASGATDRSLLILVWATLVVALAVGIAWPLLAVRRVRLAASSPTDLVVGQVADLEVEASGVRTPFEVRALDPAGSWHRAVAPASGTVDHLADRRGVFHLVRFEVRISAPIGVFEARRVVSVVLPRPVEVAPRPLDVDWRPAGAPVELGEQVGGRGGGAGDVVRSVRPYTPGDPAHLVHWPSSARTGTVVVRELEPPVPVGQAIVLDLRDLGPDTERAAAYALGAAWAVLASGGELVLCTAEVFGPAAGRVRSVLEANRRIARAVPGEPGAAPEGWPVVEIGR